MVYWLSHKYATYLKTVSELNVFYTLVLDILFDLLLWYIDPPCVFYICVKYKGLLAILELVASQPYALRAKEFLFKFRKQLQPRSLFTSTPQVRSLVLSLPAVVLVVNDVSVWSMC